MEREVIDRDSITPEAYAMLIPPLQTPFPPFSSSFPVRANIHHALMHED